MIAPPKFHRACGFMTSLVELNLLITVYIQYFNSATMQVVQALIFPYGQVNSLLIITELRVSAYMVGIEKWWITFIFF